MIALQYAVEFALDREFQGAQRGRQFGVTDPAAAEGRRVDGLGRIG
jgi:hypothetical protein